MTFQQLVDYLSNADSRISAKVLVSMSRRLFDIAYFEHNVPLDTREQALRLFTAMQTDIRQALAENMEVLAAYDKARAYQEENIKYYGYGSLAWLIEDNEVPAEHIVSFVMQPKYSHLLQNLFHVLGPNRMQQIRPELVKELIRIHAREYHPSLNGVLILHGLVAKNDQAARAIFDSEELDALATAHLRYRAARTILSNLGILPLESTSLSFHPKPNDDYLEAFMLLSSNLTESPSTVVHTESEHWPIDRFGEDEQAALKILLTTFRLYLWRNLYSDAYGQEAAEKIQSSILKNIQPDSRRVIIQHFQIYQQADTLNTSKDSKLSLDALVVHDSMVALQLYQDDKKDAEREAYFQFAQYALNYERVEQSTRNRFLLRALINPIKSEDPEVYWKDVTGDLLRYYVEGAESVESQARIYGEDWIGIW
jgi:hypothetical protein